LFKVLLLLLVLCWDYPVLLVYRLYQRAFGRARETRDADALALPLLVVIPSLLRDDEELTSMKSTVQSVLSNGYSGELALVLTIDGTEDAPPLYASLCAWTLMAAG
jgi:hypothetical protein